MKTTRELLDWINTLFTDDEENLSKLWYSEKEIIEALDILPCEELKDECLERLGIIRGLEE